MSQGLARVERWLDEQFPGMGLRPTSLTIVATLLLSVFWIYSAPRYVPDGLVTFGIELTGIQAPNFHRHLYSHTLAALLLLVIPLIYNRFTLRLSFAELGLGMKKAGREFILVGVLYLLFVPVLYVVSQQPSFQATYPRLPAADKTMSIFVLFHLAYLVKWVAWEFFFRGFLLFSYWRDVAGKAVLLSTVPFALSHYGKPPLEMLSSIAAGFILCWLALRGKSIWPGVALHWAVATTVELFAATWFTTGT